MGAAGRLRYEAMFTAQRMNNELAALYGEFQPSLAGDHHDAAAQAYA